MTIPPNSPPFTSCSSNTPLSPSRKRKRDAEVVHLPRWNLSSMPADTWTHVMEFLPIHDQSNWGRTNREFYGHIANSLFYEQVLTSSNIPLPVAPTTMATRVYTQIAAGDATCAYYFAEALFQGPYYGPKLHYVVNLLNQSISNPAHPQLAQHKQTRLSRLWKLHGLGYATGVPDVSLCNQVIQQYHTAGAATVIFSALKRAVLGFYPRDASLPQMAATMIGTTILDETRRQLTRVYIDILFGLYARQLGDRQLQYSEWRGHLYDPATRQMLSENEMVDFVQLLDTQHWYASHANPDSYNDTILLELSKSAQTDHVRALAFIQLAYLRLADRTHVITDIAVCEKLAWIRSRPYLRQAVQEQAAFLLHTYRVMGRSSVPTALDDGHLAILVGTMLSNPHMAEPTENGLMMFRREWAYDTMLRMHIENKINSVSPQVIWEGVVWKAITDVNDQRYYRYATAYLRFKSDRDLMIDQRPFTDAAAVDLLVDLLRETTDPARLNKIRLLLAKLFLAGRCHHSMITGQWVSEVATAIFENSPHWSAAHADVVITMAKTLVKIGTAYASPGLVQRTAQTLTTLVGNASRPFAELIDARLVLAQWYDKGLGHISQEAMIESCAALCGNVNVPAHVQQEALQIATRRFLHS